MHPAAAALPPTLSVLRTDLLTSSSRSRGHPQGAAVAERLAALQSESAFLRDPLKTAVQRALSLRRKQQATPERRKVSHPVPPRSGTTPSSKKLTRCEAKTDENGRKTPARSASLSPDLSQPRCPRTPFPTADLPWPSRRSATRRRRCPRETAPARPPRGPACTAQYRDAEDTCLAWRSERRRSTPATWSADHP
eukprot:scaffold2373_cov239-Pinguiococcus_pyrenoidosus.AAC.5